MSTSTATAAFSPIFSVIVPVYNAAQTLPTTVQSVLAQTCRDFELILIDDGSRDDSLTVMQGLAALDDRIRVISWSNRGVSATRNFGVELSRGTLLAFLDADDLWHPSKLARHRDLHARDRKLSASYARIAFIAADAHDETGATTTSTIVPGRLSVDDLLGENPVCTMSNLVVRRDCFNAIGPFCNSMSFAEDQEWLVRAVNGRHSIEGITELLVSYRHSPDGLSVDLDRMYAGWRLLARRYADPGGLRAAEALYCRYLARRALRSGLSPLRAVNFAVRGLKLDARAFLADARRGWLTLFSVAISPAIPRFARLRIFA